MICPPNHSHGSRTTCYAKHKCRCTGCQEGYWARRDVWPSQNKPAGLPRVCDWCGRSFPARGGGAMASKFCSDCVFVVPAADRKTRLEVLSAA